MSKRPLSKNQFIKILELVLIPSEKDTIKRCDERMNEMREKKQTGNELYGYEWGYKAGHLETLELFEKILNSLRKEELK